MHKILFLLTQQTLAEPNIGGRSSESEDNSQLILGVYALEDPTGIITIPERHPTRILTEMYRQLATGIVVAANSFEDNRSAAEIGDIVANACGGSGGAQFASGEYRSVEFPTSAKQRLLETYLT